MSLMTFYFPNEIDEHGTFAKIEDIMDEVVPHDEYVDEMLAMSMNLIDGMIQPELASPFALFGVSAIEVAEEIQTTPYPEFTEDDIVVDDLFDCPVGLVEGASNVVDPPLSFDVLSGFVSRSEDIFDIDDEIAQHYSDDDSSSASDLDPIDQRVSPTVKEEIQNQLSVGFLSVVEYPEWLANVVLVPKKYNKVRVCVDFRDFNKASPNDDFPFPHIDMLVDSTVGHSMLSFMDEFFGYNQILMALEDMEKTSFIIEWGTYYYKVMSFGLKNAGATYQRAATTLFHDMIHRDVEVYVDDMIVKSRDRSNHLTTLERFFERIRQFRLRLNPKKCTFGVTSRKLLGYMVSERGIEADPDKIRVILDMLAPRTEREVRGFLDEALGCMLAQLDDSSKEPALIDRLMRWLVLLTEFDIHYVTQKSIRGSVIADHLVSLPVSDGRAINDDFPDEDVAIVTSLSGWRMYFDGAANHFGYEIGVLLISSHGDHIPRYVCLVFSDRHPATNNIVEYEACILGLETTLELGIRQMEVFGDSNLVLRQIQGRWKTRDVKLRPYHAYSELMAGRFDDLSYTHLPRA
ncbi:hypothetical protein VitviT2T_011413 [Vitis vinifera]|uniref:Transposon Ty3-I Gag-Pol polyprotein n=1 Tax=Vitis vinifera TaxID=29760 RepID=A0ABY9CE31_VITVI|nr:hypothetical protein VitviT2T_011413 [Vitis vinifera]